MSEHPLVGQIIRWTHGPNALVGPATRYDDRSGPGRMMCRWCDEPIERRRSDYTHGWTHEYGGVYCRRTMAQPWPKSTASDPST